MSDMTVSESTVTVDTETITSLEQILAEITMLRGLMAQDQVTIDRLKAKSKVITDHTDGVLARLRVQLDALERTA